MSFDAESAVVGAILLDVSAYWRVVSIVGEDDFTDAKLRRLWTIAAERIREGVAADAVTIGDVEPGLSSLALKVASETPSHRNAAAYAEIVAKRALSRRVASAGQRIAKLSGDDALAEAQRIMATLQPRTMANVRKLKACMSEWFTDVSAKSIRDEVMTGCPTSLPKLDEMTGGWQPGELIVLASRPSVGKTALGLQCALAAALDGRPAMFFSAEMSGKQIADRAVSNLGKVDSTRLRRPKTMQEDDWTNVTTAVGRGSALPMWIDDSSPMTVDGVCGRARQMNAEHRLGLIVVDYLTHLQLPKAETVTESIQLATRMLKTLAKELAVPLMLLAQLNRDGVGKPGLHTLRGSGAIEQDADIVLLLHRPDEQDRTRIELSVGKHRNGECGEIYLHGDMTHMTFEQGFAPEKREAPPKESKGFVNRRLPR